MFGCGLVMLWQLTQSAVLFQLVGFAWHLAHAEFHPAGTSWQLLQSVSWVEWDRCISGSGAAWQPVQGELAAVIECAASRCSWTTGPPKDAPW
jgi:hypothetical protein